MKKSYAESVRRVAKTNKQEQLWGGEFGDEYHERNQIADRKEFWTEVFGNSRFNVKSVVEPGAGKGDNLVALRGLIDVTYSRLTGIEINQGACEMMRSCGLDAINGAFLDVWPAFRYDLVITRGFLIHVPGTSLYATFNRIYQLASRYICFAEYYSPERREILYHGKPRALWLDDFAGKFMHQFPDVKLVRYGFKYHADGGDDLTWFLMEKIREYDR